MPEAPPRFSITKGWPKAWPSLSAQNRARLSVPPPAPKGTITFTGLFGQGACALTTVGKVKRPAPALPASLRNVRRRMPPLLPLHCRLDRQHGRVRWPPVNVGYSPPLSTSRTTVTLCPLSEAEHL